MKNVVVVSKDIVEDGVRGVGGRTQRIRRGLECFHIP